ncbi:MAG: hypothetical protein WCO56_13315 [Verrucomicrobiota bacterium]
MSYFISALAGLVLMPLAYSATTALSAAFPVRECYCPAHFGNAYEAMGPREMAAYLAELKWMGFNRYGDWITTTDICNPYTSDAAWDLAKEQLDRKKKAFLAAQTQPDCHTQSRVPGPIAPALCGDPKQKYFRPIDLPEQSGSAPTDPHQL